MMTSEEIKNYAAQLGADLCGIASIDRFHDSPLGFSPIDVYKDTQSVISFACQIPFTQLHINSPSPYAVVEDTVMEIVKQICFKLAIYIERQGYGAVIIPSVPYDYWDAETQTGKGIVSLKHAAYKAGLGTIGKNSLLCNESYGSLIKLGAIVTNAHLKADEMYETNLCSDSCRICINACPVGAIGENGNVSQLKCRAFSEVKNKRGVEIYACHQCRNVCPNVRGKKYNLNKNASK